VKRLAPVILENLRRGEPVVQATILDHAGSTPRTAGAKMIVCPGGRIEGTIGGGLVEAEIMRAAAGMLGTPTGAIRSYDLHTGGRAETLDMLCGGRMDVLLDSIVASAENMEFYSRVADLMAKGQRGLILTRLPVPDAAPGSPTRQLLDARARPLIGGLPADAPPAAVIEAALSQRSPATYPRQRPRYLLEPLFATGTVIILGAGHVSLAVAELTQRVGFRTVIRDDREEFANRERFPEADQVEVIPSFENALSGLDIDSDSYLVIVTRGHHHDGTVLALALASRAGYIGMIGSRRKRDAIYRDMHARGFNADDIQRVHSPIGLPIDAETPEEIAVSIVAELIAVRAAGSKQDATAVRRQV
jgi:xanthine dehydrogenase accessory factor